MMELHEYIIRFDEYLKSLTLQELTRFKQEWDSLSSPFEKFKMLSREIGLSEEGEEIHSSPSNKKEDE